MLSEIFADVLPVRSNYKVEQLQKEIGMVFAADVISDARILWTLPELINSERKYITAASFFGRRRQRRYVRHVLAIVNDFDTPAGTTVEDILDCYHKAGLPTPELIVSTATAGHYQAWNIFDEPVRVRHELIMAKVTRIHETMTEALGADPAAVGAERWVRRPHRENIVYCDEYVRTSWGALKTWYESRRRPKIMPVSVNKITWIGNLLSTPAGQRIQQPNADRGCRNEWGYGLGLCLFDAGISNDDIRAKLHEWNKAIEEPLSYSDIETIYRSVINGKHHASARVLEAITGRSARIKGWYKWAKPRDRRRDHIKEIKDDVIADLLCQKTVTETQKAWAERLGIAYRSLKLVLAQLRQEGILDSSVGRGRYAQSSYCLSQAYVYSLNVVSDLEIAVGSENTNFYGLTKGHNAYSPFAGIFPPRARSGPSRLSESVKNGSG